MTITATIFGAISLFLFIYFTCAFIADGIARKKDDTIVTLKVIIMALSAVGFYLSIVI